MHTTYPTAEEHGLKGLDLLVRPIWHRIPDRVRAHIFLCMLAFYTEWHMRKALAPLLFDDEELGGNRKTRHPVTPAEPSLSAKRKKDGPKELPIHSFATLLHELGTRCRNTCRIASDPKAPSFSQVTDPTPIQDTRAFQLLGL